MNNTLKHFLFSQKKIAILKITLILLITSSLTMLFISTEQAFALPTITWSNPAGYTINEGDDIVFTPPNTFTVDADDIALVGNGPDTIDVLISSSTGDSTTLTLTESLADDGTFTNTNLIFTHGDAEFQVTNTATITIEDNCFFGSGNCNPNAIDTLSEVLSTGVTIWSSSDPGGIRIDLTETGPNTGVFTRTLHFSTIGSDPATATIFAVPGDVIIIVDQVTSAYVNGLIIPTSSDVGSVSAEIGGTVTATYNGVSVPVGIFDDGAPGRGGGGAVRPGLVLNFIFGAGTVHCSGDCIKPTLGLDFLMNRIVENGFSYNGHAVDVEEYYTPYPLITSNVGQKNVALLKIYDNGGPENIRHVSLAFGLSKGGQSISEAKAVIKWDKSFSGLETVTVKDPENALQNVAVKTKIENCSQLDEQQCLIVSISHTFRQSLGFNIVGTDVWDSNRNSKTNFYNEGIEIVGDSLNPPKQYSVIDSLGYPALITQTDNNAGIDEDGNNWKLDNQIWIKEYVIQEQLQDPIGLHGLDRNSDLFKSYINGQRFLAQESLRNIVNGKIIQNPEFSNLENYMHHPSNFDESEYEKLLQQRILNEQEIAEKRFSILYDIKHNY